LPQTKSPLKLARLSEQSVDPAIRALWAEGSAIQINSLCSLHSACPASPVKFFAKDSAADLTGVAPEDGTGARDNKDVIRVSP